jgi:hypothetical protein
MKGRGFYFGESGVSINGASSCDMFEDASELCSTGQSVVKSETSTVRRTREDMSVCPKGLEREMIKMGQKCHRKISL